MQLEQIQYKEIQEIETDITDTRQILVYSKIYKRYEVFSIYATKVSYQLNQYPNNYIYFKLWTKN